MRKKVLCVLFVFVQIFCAGCGYTNTVDKLLRVHVRGDSDSAEAQAVKREVAEVVDEYLARILSDAVGYDRTKEAISEHLADIERVAAAALRSRGCGYGATATFDESYFAERACGDTVVPAGYYDALIVRLGSGGGDNWWGVVYPRTELAEKVSYKSLIVDWLQKE